MTRLIIALRELGFKNREILALLAEHKNEIEKLFQSALLGNVEPSLEMLPFSKTFSNRKNVERALDKADFILEENKKYGIKTTYYSQEDYPKNLSKIYNAPAIVYYRGADFQDISSVAVACVGTRKPTLLSYNAVNYLVPQLVAQKCAIVSGLANGVDKLSHQACLSAEGSTIAVVAHGLDMVYPKENQELAQSIIHNGGIIMSEYSVGTKPNRYTFVDRNRLIVGMSRSLLVFECDENGGTMYNADFAERQKKPIFCPEVGRNPNDVQTGTRKLLDEKRAQLIKNGRDISGIFESMGIKIITNMSTIDIIKNYIRTLFSLEIPKVVIQKAYSALGHDIEIMDTKQVLAEKVCMDAERDISFGIEVTRQIVTTYLTYNMK